VRDLACEWLERSNCAYDVALAPPFAGGVDLHSIDARNYSHVVFVCGPFQQSELEANLLRRFGNCRLIGLNLSMTIPVNEWNPFDLLIERDSSVRCNADMAFLSRQPLVPVVGLCLVEPHEGALDQLANAAIARLLSSREMAIVEIDTRLDSNSAGLRSPAEVESLIARMDLVVTTRLHGTVLALKNGVPAIAIDPIPGGHKIRSQTETIGWPIVMNADELNDDALSEALIYCLTEPARIKAKECAKRGAKMVESIRDAFIAAITHPEELNHKYLARIAAPIDGEWMAAFYQPRPNHLSVTPGAVQKRSLRHRVEGLIRLVIRD
jgi:hypothetical protein